MQVGYIVELVGITKHIVIITFISLKMTNIDAEFKPPNLF